MSRVYRWFLWWTTPKNPLWLPSESLAEGFRKVCATKLDGVDCRTGKPLTPQAPVYRYPTPDKPRLRARECVARWMRVMKKGA